MARPESDQPLQPSFLDRLVRSDAAAGSRGRGQVLRQLKENIRRDLEDLLNTRWRPTVWPPDLNELETSLVNYGIPDFTGANLGSIANQEDFCMILQRAIQRFEPRFKSVKVGLVKNRDAVDRVLRFRIEALLHTEPAPEPVVFDSSLEPISSTFEVKGGGR